MNSEQTTLAEAGPAGVDEVGAGGVVVYALTLLGAPAPTPTEEVVWPATVMVDVVKCTFGTVTVVTSWVVMLLPEQVKPFETPVLYVAGTTTLDE